jgi:tetratricopeptide (TPR) repeat protein
VPNGFTFDQYHSAPRIFRYLVPLSFAVALHAAKMLLDLSSALLPRQRWIPVAMFLVLAVVNVAQTVEATAPARDFRRTFLAIRDDIQLAGPPVVVAESVIAEWLKNLYLTDSKSRIVTAYHTYPAHEYETWLAKTQPQLPDGSMLITGLSGYVFYGAQQDGFRLRLFTKPLSPQWSVFKNYGFMSHLPDPAVLWRLSGSTAPSQAAAEEPPLPVTGDTPESLFKNGMTHFDANEYPAARAHFKAIIERFPQSAEIDDARYFYAVTFFREQRWEEAKSAFQTLIASNPVGRWAAAGYYHMGRCDLELRHIDEARAELEFVLATFPHDTNTCSLAREALRSIPGAERGLVAELADSVRHWFSR